MAYARDYCGKSLVPSAHPNEINYTMRSVARQLQQKTPHTRKRCSQPRAIVEDYRVKRMDARRGSRKGVSVRKSDVGMMLEN